MSYTFSFYTKRPIPQIKRRPWWRVFGRDSIEYVDKWQRQCFSGLQKDEADILVSASSDYWNGPLSRLLLRLMGQALQDIQLEQTSQDYSEYVSCGVEGNKP